MKTTKFSYKSFNGFLNYEKRIIYHSEIPDGVPEEKPKVEQPPTSAAEVAEKAIGDIKQKAEEAKGDSEQSIRLIEEDVKTSKDYKELKPQLEKRYKNAEDNFQKKIVVAKEAYKNAEYFIEESRHEEIETKKGEFYRSKEGEKSQYKTSDETEDMEKGFKTEADDLIKQKKAEVAEAKDKALQDIEESKSKVKEKMESEVAIAKETEETVKDLEKEELAKAKRMKADYDRAVSEQKKSALISKWVLDKVAQAGKYVAERYLADANEEFKDAKDDFRDDFRIEYRTGSNLDSIQEYNDLKRDIKDMNERKEGDPFYKRSVEYSKIMDETISSTELKLAKLVSDFNRIKLLEKSVKDNELNVDEKGIKLNEQMTKTDFAHKQLATLEAGRRVSFAQYDTSAQEKIASYKTREEKVKIAARVRNGEDRKIIVASYFPK